MWFFRHHRRHTPPAPVLRPVTHRRGIAGEVTRAACETSDAITRATLNGLAPRIAALELFHAECVREAEEDQRLHRRDGAANTP